MAKSPNRARRGLRVLLWAALFFALVQLGGGLLLDYCWPELRFPEMDRVVTRLRELDSDPEVICMGSSRFESAVLPHIIDPLFRQYTREAPRTFNAGIPSADAVVFERLFDQTLADGRRPAMIILELSPEHICQRSRLVGSQFIRQMNWADLPDYLPDARFSTTPIQLVSARLLPLYLHRYQIRKQLLRRLLPATVNRPLNGAVAQARPEGQIMSPGLAAFGPSWSAGSNLLDLPPAMPIPPAPAQAMSNASSFETLSRCLKDFRLSNRVTSALERILNRCHLEGIKVLLVFFPAKESGRHAYKPEVEAVYQEYIQALAIKYDCRFADLRDRLPDYCFCDELHVNGLGAEFFSQILAREVLIPLWRELHP